MAEGWPRAVVFDLDGTLVDSAGDIADVLNAVLQAAGFSSIAESAVRTMIGGGALKLIERALAKLGLPQDAALATRLTAEFASRYAALGAGRSRVYPGGRALLEQLSAAGVRLGVCTNKPAAVTTSVLAALELRPFFGAIIGESEHRPKKPHPAMLLAALDQLGVGAAYAVMVGDSAIDVATARAAGVPVIIVSYGYTPIPARELGADAVVDELDQLLPVLARLALPGTADNA